MGACRLVTDILGEEVEDRLVEACLEEMDPEQIGSVAFEDFLTFFGDDFGIFLVWFWEYFWGILS